RGGGSGMTVTVIDHAIRRSNDNWPRLIRLYRFLRDHGPVHRDRIMHCCDFPSPERQPVCAYVEFQNAVMRIDAILRRNGRMVIGGARAGEVYGISEITPP